MTSNRRPTFSVILPTYNRCDVVERTLTHLLGQDYPPDHYEILVADNSSDGTPAMVAATTAAARRSGAAPVRLVSSNERLPAVKRNGALRLATGDLALFMNDDVWVTPDFLAEHAATHLRQPEPVAVLGLVEQSREMPSQPFCDWYEPFAYHEIAHLAGQPVPWRYFWSMNVSLPRREMLDRNLVFHEDWREIGHEDIELGYRWTAAGRAVIYNPRARGEHYHPHDLPSATRLQESIGRGLRDLERLIPEPELLERFGIFDWRNSRRSVARGVARRALFNPATLPVAERWLGSRRRRNRLAEWMYWKVMLAGTNRGYRSVPTRDVSPVPTLPAVAPQVEVH